MSKRVAPVAVAPVLFLFGYLFGLAGGSFSVSLFLPSLYSLFLPLQGILSLYFPDDHSVVAYGVESFVCHNGMTGCVGKPNRVKISTI